MADLEQSRGLTPADVADALARQNVILPSGDVLLARPALQRQLPAGVNRR
jgi:multidrug efflux pump subunit AcrB